MIEKITQINENSQPPLKSVTWEDFLSRFRLYHWQKGISKTISVHSPTHITLKRFKQDIRAEFADEIDTKLFTIYEYPYGFTLYDDLRRINLTDDDLLRASLMKFNDPDNFPPQLYIWNESNEEKHQSPDQMPFTLLKFKSESEQGSSNDSLTSRDSNASKKVKIRDNMSCQVCNLPGRTNLEACHIWEIKHHDKMDYCSRIELLNKLKLTSINAVQNLLTL
eukprot:gene17854-24937_t